MQPTSAEKGQASGGACKALMVVAVQEDGQGIGRIRMRRVPDASGARLQPFSLGAIARGSVVHTDGWEGYTGLDRNGYVHEGTVRKVGASELLPRVHRVVALLKRWLLGTHQGGVADYYLPYYLR